MVVYIVEDWSDKWEPVLNCIFLNEEDAKKFCENEPCFEYKEEKVLNSVDEFYN